MPLDDHDDATQRIRDAVEAAEPFVPPASSAPPTGERFVPAYVHGLKPMDAAAFLSRRFEPRELLLAPWLPAKGLTMLYGPRGVGKTHVALGVAVACASGKAFLRWQCPKPRRVVLIDGEMPGSLLQKRLASTIAAMGADPSPDHFRIVASDLEPDGLPDLADPQCQVFFDPVIAAAELVIVDNLSTICRSLRENEADSWEPVQSWALRLRREGKSVLFVHHAGKSGGQRGTSRKEDVLDTVIGLKRPPDYSPDQGARFELHFEKNRGFFGDDAEPFEAWLRADQWNIGPVVRGDHDEAIRRLHGQGLSVRDIEQRTGVSKSTVARKLKERVE